MKKSSSKTIEEKSKKYCENKPGHPAVTALRPMGLRGSRGTTRLLQRVAEMG